MLQILRRIVVVLIVVCAVAQIGSHTPLRASVSGVVISQVYGGGGNSNATYRNDFVELFNAGSAPVSLAGKSIQYASASGTGNFGATSGQMVTLSGTIAPGQYFLVQLAGGTTGAPLPVADATGTINMSGTSGKVALVDSSASLGCNGGSSPCSAAQLALIVDLVGYGSTNFSETAPAPGTPNNATAVIRKNGGAIDSDNNAADFVIGTPTPRNSGAPTSTVPAIAATPILVAAGDPVRLTVKITPGANPASTGIAVTGNLAAIGGQAAQAFYDDGTNGDAVAGDAIYSFQASSIPTPGVFSLSIGATDAQGRSALPANLPLTVAPVVAIHDVQGPGTISPYVGQAVATTGIVTGVKYNGFFIQTSDTDNDPNTSEGVFVYTGSTPPDVAVVGNIVRVLATVSEYKNTSADPDGLSMTELVGPVTTLLSSENTLPAAVSLGPSDLDPLGSRFALEKYEGMRVHVETLTSIGPTGGSNKNTEQYGTSVTDGLFFGVLPGTARPFREPGIETPLPVPPEAPAGVTPPVFDANPERLGVDTFSVFLDPASAAVYPPPAGATLEVTTGVTVTDITGPLDYAYRSYIVDAEGWSLPTASANGRARPVRPRGAAEFSVATMNMARFYDTTDDDGVSDVALTPEAFDMRLTKASLAIRTVMQAPDIVGVEEVENLATLQAIADRVYQDSAQAVQYDAYLEEGNDIGGIDVGFLVRHGRMTGVSVEQYSKSTTYVEPGGKTAILNDRPTLELHGTIANAPYDPYPVTVLVNHLRSMSGIDGSDGERIRAKRLAQAVDLANELQRLQAAGERVISVGDYNAFDVNDGYVDVMGLLKGTEAGQSEVALWAPSPVTPALVDAIALAPAAERYSFLFDGNAQEIDHILATSTVTITGIAYARINADFPDSLRGDGTTPERLSDHDPIVAYFATPDRTAPVLDGVVPSASALWPPNHEMVPVTLTPAVSDAVDPAPACTITGVTADDGATDGDWSWSGLTVSLRAARQGDGKGRTYWITVVCRDASGNESDPATATVLVPHDQRK